MTGSFTVELFDVLVYLLPGLLTFLGLYWLFSERFQMRGLLGSSISNVVYVLLISFFLGVLVHIFSGFAYGVFRRAGDVRFIQNVVSKFEDMDKVRGIVTQRLDSSDSSDVAVYRYAEAVVIESANHHSASYSRMMALSILCRNSMIPLSLLFLVLGYHLKFTKWYYWIGLSILLISTELLLYRGMVMFWYGAIKRVLRAVLILYGFS